MLSQEICLEIYIYFALKTVLSLKKEITTVNLKTLSFDGICYDLIPFIYTIVPLVESFRTMSHSTG